MTTADQLTGTRRVQVRGDHAGTEVEVVGETDTTVKFRVVGKRLVKGQRADPSQIHTVSREQFMTLTREYDSRMDPITTQPAYRRVSPRRISRLNGQDVGTETALGQVMVPTSPGGLSVTLTTITPDMAKAWLDRSLDEVVNRFLNRAAVTSLAAAMRRGEWRVTGDTIKLDQNGRIRDGQHRLWACIEAMTPIQSLVVYGIEEEAFDVMDIGRRRSIGDVLHIRGFENRNELGTTVRNLLTYETTGRIAISTRESRSLVTPTTTLDYITMHPEVKEAVRVAMVIRKADLPGGVGLWACLLELFRRLSVEDTATFIHRMVTGEELVRGDPILVLRNRLMSRAEYWVTVGRKDREALAAAIIKAWNAWRRNEDLDGWRALHWRGKGRSAEPFPTPV